MKQSDSFISFMPRVRRFVLNKTQNTDVANDVVQETMLRTFRCAPSDPLQSPLAYMLTVAKSVLSDHWRVEKKHQVAQELNESQAHHTDIEFEYLNSEKVRIIAQLLEGMPPLRRKVFEMRRIEGKSREEIAQELDLSVEAVKKHINRAMVEVTLCAEKHGWEF
ncbi:RNA polymerase sigma factor [Paraglaciecola agarilytica]|uniref:RNA polymerase sigma factor n=1 Tax=Paraglaciecola chathamensis TaxID=368405 RepID=UPI001C08151B|nr:RNA polymerase sigma factor [Paraglaciecola agarilytica]MBU3018692.1 RNA polymerase sigma factor [Paraglaciecola agarilytica]